MNWQKAKEAERVMMQCLVALFLSLAASCDRAAGDTHARRRWVLDILRHASASAFKMASHHAAWFDMWIDLAPHMTIPRGDGPDDAAQLAHYFRVMSQVLLNLLALLPQADPASGDACVNPSGRVRPLAGPRISSSWWRGLGSPRRLTRSRDPPRLLAIA